MGRGRDRLGLVLKIQRASSANSLQLLLLDSNETGGLIVSAIEFRMYVLNMRSFEKLRSQPALEIGKVTAICTSLYN